MRLPGRCITLTRRIQKTVSEAGVRITMKDGSYIKPYWNCFFVHFSFSSRLLNVLEVVAPFKHFNKLREFVQMKLPPGFPVKLGMWRRSGLTGGSACQSPGVHHSMAARSSPNQNALVSSLSRHPGLPHHHRHRHLPGVPLQWIRGIDFRHPCWIQGRSQSLPRPLMWLAFSHLEGPPPGGWGREGGTRGGPRCKLSTTAPTTSDWHLCFSKKKNWGIGHLFVILF